MTVLGDGRIFTVGGSWHGGIGGKDGEIWSPTTNKWTKMSGVPVDPLLTADNAGVYRSDNHIWLFQSPVEDMVFHAGPSKTMNWIDMSGKGYITPSAKRGNADQMNGNALMLDVGIIFIAGGAPNYDTGSGTNRAYLVDINDPKKVKSRQVGSMSCLLYTSPSPRDS